MQEEFANKPGKTGITRLIDATCYSWQGLLAAWRNEAAFRQEVTLAVFLIPLALWLGDSGVERAMMIGATLLVMIVELLNSAVEAAIDRIGPEKHPLSKFAKDTGSAAVSLSLLLWLFTWGCILLPRWIGG
ncbi:diacylglycerol kinase [Microbulbifer thermotolerans]|uniref:Diacylglycerol kinase n=1 Tax=Microbulbifer thermotolerans TaxID=252514 RepID=A0AB35I3F9_MICTH|nr:diacylglycerol kinase [Microbulbifer thermotolerans]MCX2803208.1 diacylglycerol kinase [Microbulbifer thermotolerans]MCX2832541.1 diacylglycerol kinase [Microbulbifer thermotolerans]MCX2834084.1 diacylglycerol kinase [Microbulbifer thermotolerans]MCX2842724.1 diacylglycerol kinase [Microbulbifer thermotolerans]